MALEARMKRNAIIIIFLTLFISILLPSYAGAQNVDLNFVDEDVRTIFYTLASVSHTNIIVDDVVQGKITIRLNNVPLETAIDLITKTKGLTYQKVGDVIAIGTPNHLGRGFGNIHVYKLKYAQPNQALNMIMAMLFGEKAGVKESAQQGQQQATQQSSQQTETTRTTTTIKTYDRVQIDEAINSIIFYGSQNEADQIEKLITEIDIPAQQVSLEAQVIAISKSALKDLGVDWEWQKAPTYAEYEQPTIELVADGTDANGNTKYREVTTEQGKFTRNKSEMIGTIRFGRSPNGFPYEFLYQAKISALISNGNAKVLARPKVTTINGKQAYILIGDSIPVPVTTTQNDITTNSYEYKDAGIMLKYTPRINSDGKITAVVHTEVSTPILIPSLNAYQITKREASTEVRLNDGETMVIGGLIGSQESGGKNKVPFLGDLPLIGKLFQSVHESKTETEVVIFLTPHIVN
ncbi:Type IV pilus biogenesis and competence protein PilQ [bioreactor metagenome]|uniref:Type IV pilus biogenesis and competence protein PilQ n=1 Tax=bioreactor metagenome TaxID=1076179 RepID=A0A644T0E5_9ZZZZ